MFTDRIQAGHLLAAALGDYKNTNSVVLAVPRGGLPIGAIIARALNLPLDIVLTKKIGHPYNREYAIGAVSLKSKILDPEASRSVSPAYIQEEIKHLRTALKDKMNLYYQGDEPLKLKGKTLIVVDDGIATGNTILATVKLLAKEKPKAIIIAIPVSSKSALTKLQNSNDVSKVVCLLQPDNFYAVGAFYQDFSAVSDMEAIQLLKENKNNQKMNYTPQG
ncbi:phosphoribosyltransferase [Gaetbulibacter aestuarii]|uniref:Phosphoribosyltransferase family protein n=1 Tax=Gaetbulibacter aestuarii TaxID=1502358 RepID=A0ABW7MZH1_9FLAO